MMYCIDCCRQNTLTEHSKLYSVPQVYAEQVEVATPICVNEDITYLSTPGPPFI